MDAVTYPDDDVSELLNEQFVCLQPHIEEQSELADRFGVKWTPGLVWLDRDGRQVHDNVGFFEPRELMAECTYAQGRAAVRAGDWDTALERFESVIARWPASFAAPAALYWAGCSAKLKSDRPEPLLKRWRQLLRSYEDSSWAMKVSFLKEEDAS